MYSSSVCTLFSSFIILILPPELCVYYLESGDRSYNWIQWDAFQRLNFLFSHDNHRALGYPCTKKKPESKCYISKSVRWVGGRLLEPLFILLVETLTDAHVHHMKGKWLLSACETLISIYRRISNKVSQWAYLCTSVQTLYGLYWIGYYWSLLLAIPARLALDYIYEGLLNLE